MSDLVWIDERDALALHGRLLTIDGVATGVRDKGLLQSALARPQQIHAYGDNPDIVELSAAYTAGIVRNHPFLDGNKRTGFLLGILFLEMNGFRLSASEEDAAQAVFGLAAGKLDEKAFTDWLRGNVKGETSSKSRKRREH